MARSKRAKQWTGILAEPINGPIMPLKYPANSPEFEKWLDAKCLSLHRLRVEKMPELARQLGMQVDKFDLTTHRGLMVFYGQLALNLALKLEIPGYMEAKPKWPREIVYAAMQDGNARRARGERDPDLTACLFMVRAFDRNLRRNGERPAAIRRAKTLRNEVSKLRGKIKTQAGITVDEDIKRRGARGAKVIKLHKTMPLIP
jgi:hypothetical protein